MALILELALLYRFLISFTFSIIWKCDFSVKCISKHMFYIRQSLILQFDLNLTGLWRVKPSNHRASLGLWSTSSAFCLHLSFPLYAALTVLRRDHELCKRREPSADSRLIGDSVLWLSSKMTVSLKWIKSLDRHI